MPTLVTNWRNGTPSVLQRNLGPEWSVIRPNNRAIRDLKVVNWGSSHPLFIRHDARIINNPDAVAVASSKLYSLRLLSAQKVPCLEFTQDSDHALEWLIDGSSVVCRDVDRGHGGNGIRIIRRKDWHTGGRVRPDFGNPVLFTRYFRKQLEVRVHATRDKILAVAEKRKRLGQPGDYWVRSHSRGWIFAEARAEFGKERVLATEAIKALGLDFGAVDIGIAPDGNSVVFEVNTAPGLEGRTLNAYVDFLREL